MDPVLLYCSERKQLENSACNLVTRLYRLTLHLMTLIGKDHTDFVAAQVGCAEMRQDIVEARARLVAHRAAHGC